MSQNISQDNSNADDPSSVTSDNYFLDDSYFNSSVETQQALSPADTWRSDNMSSSTLVIGEGSGSTTLRDSIKRLLVSHDIQLTKDDDAFELCNQKTYQLIWLLMSVPVSQELVSLTTSIRYASKSNRGTVIIGVADTSPDIDLRLHGIDEVVLGPVSLAVIKLKYAKWTSVQVNFVPDEPSSPVDDINFSSPSTPVSDDPDRSALNFSVDSGVDSTPSSISTPSPVPGTQPGSTPNSQAPPGILNLRNLNSHVNVTLQPRVHHTVATDHTTKEKLRRERIKDSCDQLRVLLPYIRGRKTDMASILEMCVDYLKIVNAALPQEFQNQIVEVLSRDCKPSPRGRGGEKGGRRGRKTCPTPESPSTVTSTVENSNNAETTPLSPINEIYKFSTQSVPQRTPEQQQMFKRASYVEYRDLKPAKRVYQHGDENQYGRTAQEMAIAAHIQQENTNRGDLQYGYNQQSLQLPHVPVYPDMDPFMGRMCNTMPLGSENLSPGGPFYTGQVPIKTSPLERDPYAVFMDAAPQYSFYSTVQSTATAGGVTLTNSTVADYVNPNVVLPLSHGATRFQATSSTPTKKEDAEKTEDTSKENQVPPDKPTTRSTN